MKTDKINILNYAKNNLHKFTEIGISSNKIHLFEYNEKKYISKIPLMIENNLSPFWIMMKNIFSFTFEKQISQLKNLYSTLKENPHIPFAPFVISDKNIMIYEFVEGESFDSDEFPKGDNNAYKLGKFIGYNHQTSHKNCGIIGIEDINNFSQKLFSHMRECINLHWNTNSLIDKKVNQYFNLLSKNDFTSNKFSLTMIDISADQFLYKKENIICCVDLDAYVIGPVEWELTFLKNQIEDWQSFKSGYETYQPIPEFEKSSKLFLFLMALNSYHKNSEMKILLNKEKYLKRKFMIKKIRESNLQECVNVIKESFITVANEFNITTDNAPGFTAFSINEEKLKYQLNVEQRLMFGFFENNTIVGYFSLLIQENGECELSNLCVLPSHRHKKIGEKLLEHVFKVSKVNNCKIINIGIVEENTILKNWYQKFGFEHTNTIKYDFFPFTCGYMKKIL